MSYMIFCRNSLRTFETTPIQLANDEAEDKALHDWTDDFKKGQKIVTKSGVVGFLVRITEDLDFIIQPAFCMHTITVPLSDVVQTGE